MSGEDILEVRAKGNSSLTSIIGLAAYAPSRSLMSIMACDKDTWFTQGNELHILGENGDSVR